MPFAPALPSGRKVLLLDALLVLWVAAWIAMGLAVGDSVSRISRVTDGFFTVGGAIDATGRAIGSVSLPLLERPLAPAGRRVSQAGRSVLAQGRSGKREIDRASVLLGLSVALIPTLPILLFYLPPRLWRAREAAALRRLVAGARGDPVLERLLAQRAMASVPYARLRRLGDRPWLDFEEGRHRALAAEELRRLGLSPARLEEPPERA
jgi:hypothetical protein